METASFASRVGLQPDLDASDGLGRVVGTFAKEKSYVEAELSDGDGNAGNRNGV